MKTARRFLILTILLTILLVLLFMIPEGYGSFKLWLGLLCVLVLSAFMLTLWSWRKKLSPDEKKEIEMTDILPNISGKSPVSYND